MLKRLLIVIATITLIPAAFAQGSAKVACNSTCLKSYVDRYLDAMQADNPNTGLFAQGIKFTENGVQLPLGNEGLWYDMSGKGHYKFYIPDIETQQIAFIGTVREGGKTTHDGTLVAIALRLKIVKKKITEAEQLVIRPERSLRGGNNNSSSGFSSAGENLDKLGAPDKIYSKVVPVNERPSRAAMIKTANYYFSGMQNDNGKGYYPFAKDCNRRENGIQTTNVPLKPGQKMPDPKTAKTYSASWSCKQQFESGLLKIVTRIRDRRYVAVDRKHGIVFAFGFFDHRTINWTWEIAELFKIQNGLIHRITAVLQRCPYGMNSGWSTYQQGMSEKMQIIY